MRALALLYKGGGESFRQIANVLQIRLMTAVATVERYRPGGLVGLRRGGQREATSQEGSNERDLKDLVRKTHKPLVISELRGVSGPWLDAYTRSLGSRPAVSTSGES
ncbi:MAG: hypothetical protein QXI39_02575 [Candidatus Bathyarchaeia archaeon]